MHSRKLSLVAPDDELQHLPPDAELGRAFGEGELPLVGDVIFLSPRSSWQVVARSWDLSVAGEVLLRLQLLHAPEYLVLRKPAPPKLVPRA